ncbi:MAG TPA: hypothetical protein DEP45_10585 [Armatimonadetes bacterium]|nr:hypothetical protein [Armatimonadota bacterium]
MTSRSLRPASGPSAIDEQPCGMSATSHDSPIGSPGGSVFPRILSRPRQPQILGLSSGRERNGQLSGRMGSCVTVVAPIIRRPGGPLLE